MSFSIESFAFVPAFSFVPAFLSASGIDRVTLVASWVVALWVEAVLALSLSSRLKRAGLNISRKELDITD